MTSVREQRAGEWERPPKAPRDRDRPDRDRPTLPEGRSIVAFSSNDWTDLPSSSSQIMSVLARQNRVLFVDTLGIRNPGPSVRDARRALEKLRGAAKGVRHVRPNLWVWSPIVIPFHGSATIRRLNGLWLSWRLRSLLSRLDMEEPVVYTALPSAVEVVERLPSSAVVYHCVDDYREFTDAPVHGYVEMEEKLLERADLTVVTSHRLLELRRKDARNIVRIPHGVDVPGFLANLDRHDPVPELADVPGPVAGCIGRIGDWIDLDLIASCARRMPGWTFVMVGPSNVPLEPYREIPNLRFLGRKDHERIPHFLQRFDVCLLPFADNEVTRSVNPLKLYEYLALGRPVVSVPMPDVAEFGKVVSISDRDRFADAIRSAREEDSTESRDRRRRFVERYSWESVASRMFRRLDEVRPSAGSGSQNDAG